MESILTSIKKLLGIAEDDDYFNQDIIMHINSVFSILTDLGVGPSEGFRIEDDVPTWNDFVGDSINYESVKSYMYLRVKLLFDSSTLSSAVIEAMNRMIHEFEWRLNVNAETKESS